MSKRRDPFAALGDPTRRAILDLLRTRESCTAGEIGARFRSISRPAVSKHLRVLRESGLVSARAEGREWNYSLDADALGKLYVQWLSKFAPLWEQSLERLKRQAEEDE